MATCMFVISDFIDSAALLTDREETLWVDSRMIRRWRCGSSVTPGCCVCADVCER